MFFSRIVLFCLVTLQASAAHGSEENTALILQYLPGISWNGEVGARVEDSSGREEHGLVVDGPVPVSVDIPPGVQEGRSFDFSSDEPNGCVVTEARNLLDNYTIAKHGGFGFDVWFKVDSLSANDGSASLICYAGTEQLQMDVPADQFKFTISDGGASVLSAQSLSDLADGQWHHATARFVVTDATQLAPIIGDIFLTVDGSTRSKRGVELSSFGDQLNRAIGIGNHPERLDGCGFSGYLYGPTVFLGPGSGSANWAVIFYYFAVVGLTIGILIYGYRWVVLMRVHSEEE